MRAHACVCVCLRVNVLCYLWQSATRLVWQLCPNCCLLKIICFQFICLYCWSMLLLLLLLLLIQLLSISLLCFYDLACDFFPVSSPCFWVTTFFAQHFCFVFLQPKNICRMLSSSVCLYYVEVILVFNNCKKFLESFATKYLLKYLLKRHLKYFTSNSRKFKLNKKIKCNLKLNFNF